MFLGLIFEGFLDFDCVDLLWHARCDRFGSFAVTCLLKQPGVVFPDRASSAKVCTWRFPILDTAEGRQETISLLDPDFHGMMERKGITEVLQATLSNAGVKSIGIYSVIRESGRHPPVCSRPFAIWIGEGRWWQLRA